MEALYQRRNANCAWVSQDRVVTCKQHANSSVQDISRHHSFSLLMINLHFFLWVPWRANQLGQVSWRISNLCTIHAIIVAWSSSIPACDFATGTTEEVKADQVACRISDPCSIYSIIVAWSSILASNFATGTTDEVQPDEVACRIGDPFTMDRIVAWSSIPGHPWIRGQWTCSISFLFLTT